MQKRKKSKPAALSKAPTGIRGFDEVTRGGLPRDRATLLCGGAGCGKTLFAMEFLVRGAVEYNEPGVFMSFEESDRELLENVSSLGIDLDALVKKKKIVLDYVYIERSEIEETGEYDLEGLFIRLDHAVNSVGAKRVVLDTIEALFSGFSDPNILRAELRRLLRWFKEKGIAVVITAERGEGTLTRHGIEEYVSDCVVLLDHRVTEEVSTRRLRVLKYRGSTHGANEYPFLIDDQGISVLPITSLALDYAVSSERIPTGLSQLDAMLGGKGFYKGSSILVSGTAGTGKSSLAAAFGNETCRSGKRCLFFAFEESQNQIIRNMHSIGIDLEKWIRKKLLHIHAARPTFHGMEMHLVEMHRAIKDLAPDVVVVDPITNFVSIGSKAEVKSMLTRILDFMKGQGITVLFTNLSHAGNSLEQTEAAVSSLMDTWILVRDVEETGERTRGIYVLKSRGMSHSKQVRELVITDRGLDIKDVYLDGKKIKGDQ
jgi:circadian clock protein KaiC